MVYGILLERIEDTTFPAGYYYAHIPSLGLTTHGRGIKGARAAAADLIKLWLAEKIANGEQVHVPSELLYSTVEVDEHVVQSA